MRITDQTHWNQRVRWKSLSRSQQGSITTQTSDGRQLYTQTLSETKHRNIEQQQNSSQEDENCRGAARGKETKSCQPGLKQDSVDASRTVWGSTRRIFVSPMDQKNNHVRTRMQGFATTKWSVLLNKSQLILKFYTVSDWEVINKES